MNSPPRTSTEPRHLGARSPRGVRRDSSLAQRPSLHRPPPLLALGLLTLACCACGSLDRTLDRATTGNASLRAAAIAELEAVVRDAPKGDPASEATRERLDTFFRARFAAEPESTIRSQILALASQGELPCARQLIEAGLRERRQPLTRIIALQLVREHGAAGLRDLLLKVATSDRDFMVRLEAVRTMAYVEVPETERVAWAVPLVQLFLDPAEDSNLQLQAYDAVRRLTGLEIPLEKDRAWREWLREHGS